MTDSGTSRAEFTWGNSAAYRKYYTDYRAFLLRPVEVCRHYYSMKPEEAELGVVSLDLQGFYDAIPPGTAVAALKKLCEEQGAPSDDRFWEAVDNCLRWKWDPADEHLKTLTKTGELPRGLPQGLVAAGFLSNAYMVAFDRAVAKTIKRVTKAKPNGKWQIVDYCRYVDDIRLVVIGDAMGENTEVQSACTEWFGTQMKKHIHEQTCNHGKTAYVSQEELESRTVRPTLMSAIQEKLSGPADMETLEQAGFALDSLLNTIGEEEAGENKDISQHAKDEGTLPTLALARIHFAKHSVRDDTVVRFAGYRKLTSLRARRYLLAAQDSNARTSAMKRIDAEIEISARRMVRLWSRDPSLAIVLRHALNLFPSPELLEPVIEALSQCLFPNLGASRDRAGNAFMRAVALFTAGELFKAGAIETGIDVSPIELPEKADLEGYREALADFADRLLNAPGTPWYVSRQAALFLLSITRIPSLHRNVRNTVGADYEALAALAAGSSSASGKSSAEHVSLILVLDQLGHDRRKTLNRLRRVFAHANAHDQRQRGEQLYLANPDVAIEFLRYLKTKRTSDVQYASLFGALPPGELQHRHLVKDLGANASLLSVMSALDNPFIQETAALQLLRALIKALLAGTVTVKDLYPERILLSCGKWSELRIPKTASRLSITKGVTARADPRYVTPEWASGERERLYALGRLVRAAVIGKTDYTATGFQLDQFRDGYRGLRSSWFKRQNGLSNCLSLSEWEPSSCSPWFASLVMQLLAWPGSRKDPESEFSHVSTVGDLQRAVRQRLNRLKDTFGWSSGMPVYPVDIKHALKEPPIISMAMLQTVRPTHQDLKEHGPALSTDQFRPIHRSHLATMLRIAADHVKLRSTYDKKPNVDLVVLPEISVHRDDLDLLERFIDATRAIVFCGLCYFHHRRRGGLVNSGLWIVPDQRKSGRTFSYLLQGKEHMIPAEHEMQILPHRPHQYVLRLNGAEGSTPYAISGAICFDATDLHLAADLRNQTDMLIVPANNRDVATFDIMAAALSWHMFQHIVIVNSGEFGGSVVSAPYKERYLRVVKHDHGGDQAAISIVDIDLSDYQRMREKPPRELKSPPAGFSRH